MFGENGTGGFAEYATANVDLIAHKPKTVALKMQQLYLLQQSPLTKPLKITVRLTIDPKF